MKRRVVYDLELQDPPERVWRVLTDRDELNTFLTDLYNNIVRCDVVEIDEPRLSYRWTYDGVVDEVVTVRLSRTAHGSRLHIEHSEFDGVSAAVMGVTLANGWKKLQLKLRELRIVATGSAR